MSKRLLFLPCLLALSALVLSSCGSGEDETSRVEEVIETSATSTDPADCKKLNTQHFMEQTGQESGKAALGQCEEEAEKEEGAKSASVSNVEVEGSNATADAALSGGSLDGQTVQVALVKDGDQWKLNEVVKFAKFDQAKLVQSFEREFSKHSSELPSKFASCFIEAFRESSQAEVEELFFSGSSKGFEEVAEGCS